MDRGSQLILAMHYFLIVVIAFLPALFWLFLWRLQDKEEEPLRAMLWCFFFGMLATVPFFLIERWGGLSSILGLSPTWSLFFLALLEEITKALMVIAGIEMSQRWFTQIVDGFIYASAVALGFSFVENVMVFSQLGSLGESSVVVYLVRSLNTMLGHTLFTAMFGFFYASAYLRKDIFPKKKREKPWRHFWSNLWESLPLHVTLFHILPNRPSKYGHFPGSLLFEGLLLASLLHGFFNVLWSGRDWGFLTAPFLFVLVYLVWRMFFQRVYIKIVKRVKG